MKPGIRVSELVDQIREDMGPFFVSRLFLRGKIPTEMNDNDAATIRMLVQACVELGYDPDRRLRISAR